MSPLSDAEVMKAFRARKAEKGLKEVRGIYATESQSIQIKANVKRWLKRQHAKSMKEQ